MPRRPQTRSRKREEDDDDAEWIVGDDEVEYEDGYDLDEEDDEMPPKRRRKDNPVEKLLSQYDVTEQMVMDAQFSNEDKIWLIERIRVLRRMDRGSLDWLNLRHTIHQKFRELHDQKEEDLEVEKQVVSVGNDTLHLKLRILRSTFDIEVKAIIYRKYQKLIRLPTDSEEFHKLKEWIEHVLNVPNKVKPIFTDENAITVMKTVNSLNTTMNKYIYGMRSVKERIVGIVLSTLYTDTSSHHRCIAMVGPSGIGKTLFGMSIAEALGLPFSKISLSGMADQSVLSGHDYTYIGASPGLIARSIQQMGYRNGVMYLDEIDKCSANIQRRLLQVLDRTQNHHYSDNYMPEIPIDLSQVLFIITANSLDDMPVWMVQRMPIIQLNDFSPEEKMDVTKDYLIPKIAASLQLNPKEFRLPPKVIKHLVESSISSGEVGIRTIENNLQIIFQKLNVLKFQKLTGDKSVRMSYHLPHFKIPMTLTTKDIDLLLPK